MFKVYISDYVFADLEPEKEILKDIAQVIPLQCSSNIELAQKATDADALMNTYLDHIDATVMDAMKNLKVIVRYGVGANTIDLDAATARGIQVANVPDYCMDEVSDHAVALALDIIRKISLSSNRIKQNADYSLSYVNPVLPLKDAAATIFGFGRIGRLIAKKLNAFGCNLRFFDPYINEDCDCDGTSVKKVSIEEAFAESDIIVLQSPLTKETYHMLNENAFAMMRKKPYIINTSRGELIDTQALICALKTGIISGAALDVVEDITPLNPENELFKFENVILTPHSAWVSGNSLRQLQVLAAMEVERALKGEGVKYLVNQQVKNIRK